MVSHSLHKLNNILRFSESIFPCCDICVLRKVTNIEMTPAEADLLTLCNCIGSPEVRTSPANNGETQQREASSDEDQTRRNTDPQATKRPCHPGPCRKERLEASRNVLMNWRHKTWQTGYKNCIWGPNVLLPDTILTKIATHARIQMLNNIKKEIPEWIWADEYGETILKLLEPIDRSWHEENERKKAENKAK